MLVSSTVSGTIHAKGSNVIGPAPISVLAAATLIEGTCTEEDEVTLTSSGHNIESPGNTCGFDQGTDQVVPDPMLGPLQDNGGPTWTHALLPGSPAINQIPKAACEVETDQRGEPRPETGGTMCDVGAFEVQP